MTTPLYVTRDEALLEGLLRLAAAAGVTPDLARDVGSALRAWTRAGLVVVGADLADELARLSPVRRSGVHVVSWRPVPDELFRTGVEVGAESVTELRHCETWLTEALIDLGDHQMSARGLVVGVIGGSGGAGATTFACALGQLASRSGPTVVIDADPLGPGLDRVLGLEDVGGERWDALCRPTGRLSARALREALPRRGSLGVLTWRAGATGSLQAFAMREALSAARRGHDTVVVDLPRVLDELVEEVVDRCDQLYIVVVPSVAGVAAAARLCGRLGERSGVQLVVRGLGVAPREVSRVTGLPVATAMVDQRGLAESIDLGLGPVRSRRGALGRAAEEVLTRVAMLGAAA